MPVQWENSVVKDCRKDKRWYDDTDAGTPAVLTAIAVDVNELNPGFAEDRFLRMNQQRRRIMKPV